jgi:hypothetical protein
MVRTFESVAAPLAVSNTAVKAATTAMDSSDGEAKAMLVTSF